MAKSTAKYKSQTKISTGRVATEESPIFYSKWWIATVFILSTICSLLNTKHISTLFENDRHFSHLADFEREMAYRTEMGLYYSYYKTIINAPSFLSGLYQITHDNVTEYGHMINTLKRFNLYPEVYLSFGYRQFKALVAALDWNVENCWQVNRGDGLSPVQSCEGIGNAHYFYINNVFALAGTTAGLLFVMGVLVSDSLFGGILSVACFAFNHGEATRVQWTPPLRESFAFPLILGQITVVTYILKNKRSGYFYSMLMAFFATNSMLFWQFSQFAYFTQLSSLFVVYIFDYIPFSTMKTLAVGHLFSFITSFALLFGNEMLLTSVYFPCILALMIILFCDSVLNRISFRFFYLLFTSTLFIGSTLGLKLLISRALQVEDDAHIFDILRSKFTDYANFHTRLYTCSAEFDFIPTETINKLNYTFLIPAAAFGIVLFAVSFLVSEWNEVLWRRERRRYGHSEIFYNVVQLVCYTAMTVLIMRLKLFFTPHLCVCSALLANNKLLESTGLQLNKRVHLALVMLLLAGMGHQGKANINKQLSIRGEYSNPEQEKLFTWIMMETEPNAVFAGTMPVMANVKLSTGRPIVNHPHYEEVGIRERTLKVYSMFSKKSIEDVHRTLKEMGVNYFVFQLFNCAPDVKRPYCAYRGMWDEEDPTNKNRISLCDLYAQAAHSGNQEMIKPFRMVYNANRNYIVLKV